MWKIITGIVAAIIALLGGVFIGRKSGHNESGIGAALDGEGKLQDGISEAERREHDFQGRASRLDSRIDAAGAGISNLEAGIPDTDRLADELKKRNNLG